MPSRANIKIACVAPNMLEAMWPLVGPLLLRGHFADTSKTVTEASAELVMDLKRIKVNLAQCWIVVDDDAKAILAAMVSEIVKADDGRRVVFVSRMAGDDIAKWGHAISEAMAAFAKAEKCAAVQFYGRKALERAYTGIKAVGTHPSGATLYERAAQ